MDAATTSSAVDAATISSAVDAATTSSAVDAIRPGSPGPTNRRIVPRRGGLFAFLPMSMFGSKRRRRRLIATTALLLMGPTVLVHRQLVAELGSAAADSDARNSPSTEAAALRAAGAARDASAAAEDDAAANARAGLASTGVTLPHVVGDPRTCEDVVYTGYTTDPADGARPDVFWRTKTGKVRLRKAGMVHRGWNGTAHLLRTAPALRRTCGAFFRIPTPLTDGTDGPALHPVWARLPATALVLAAFPRAETFLYVDADGLLASPDASPADMYAALAPRDDARQGAPPPGLVVNKPRDGWLCKECARHGLGHGCFNSGALLWRRAGAGPVLRAWWAARDSGAADNFFPDPSGAAGGGRGFHGWAAKTAAQRRGDHMGEQNRLMWVYATDERVRDLVWPVPRRASRDGVASCPKQGGAAAEPCLQSTFNAREAGGRRVAAHWNATTGRSCFVSHYTKGKELIAEHAALMIHGRGATTELDDPAFAPPEEGRGHGGTDTTAASRRGGRVKSGKGTRARSRST